MSPIVLAIVVFIGVAALVGGVAVMFRGSADSAVEDRLDVLTGIASPKPGELGLGKNSVLAQALYEAPGFFERLLAKLGNLALLFEQADTSLTPGRFFLISACVGAAGAVVSIFAGLHYALAPLMGLVMSGLPLWWLVFRRKKRLKQFGAQLPDALELVARALRSGHSLAAAFDLVAQEMSDPIGKEFERVYEEQNLGIALDEALDSMTVRVPNLDLRFFATAVILQRQTGGDLAEILDKIGHLIRERFQILGQVQALTGEGRLSGVVLLGLPPVLFIAVYKLNPDYVMMLFTDPMGKKLLAGAVLLQLLGAIVIRKIVNIKV